MRRRISRKTAAAVLVAGATLVVGTTVASSAVAGTHSGSTGKESFLLSYGPHESEVVVAHGTFTSGGKDVAGNNSDTLHLGGGSLRINHPGNKSKYHQHLNPTTCYASFTVTGPYTLDRGTGKYAGYTGQGTYKVVGEAIAKHTKSGGCDQRSAPKVEAAFIRASGTLTK